MFHLGESSKIECWLLTFSFSFWSTWGKTSSNEVSSKIPLGACEWPKRRHEGFITWVFKGPKSFSSPGTKVAEVPVSKRPAVVWWFCPWLLLAPRWHQVCSLMPPQSEWQRKCFDSNSPQSFSLESLQCMRSVFIASDGCSPFEMTNIYIYIVHTTSIRNSTTARHLAILKLDIQRKAIDARSTHQHHILEATRQPSTNAIHAINAIHLEKITKTTKDINQHGPTIQMCNFQMLKTQIPYKPLSTSSTSLISPAAKCIHVRAGHPWQSTWSNPLNNTQLATRNLMNKLWHMVCLQKHLAFTPLSALPGFTLSHNFK